MKAKAGDGVTVYDYTDKEDDDDLRGAVVVVLTEYQSASDMAAVLVDSFGVEHCAGLAAALQQRVRAAQVGAQMRKVVSA